MRRLPGCRTAAVDAGRTTGDHQTPALAEYTVLIQARMDRLGQDRGLDPDLRGFGAGPRTDLAGAERRLVGDAAQNLPASRMADSAPAIRLSCPRRDAHPDLMDRYLTQGSRSIPNWWPSTKLGTELFTRGPRPDLRNGRSWRTRHFRWMSSCLYPELARKLHTWYAQDPDGHPRREFIALLKPRSHRRPPAGAEQDLTLEMMPTVGR